MSHLVEVETRKKDGTIITPSYYGLPRWTPHDLRRTMRTNLSRFGISREVAEAIINHGKQGIERVYNLYQYDKERRTAMLTWAWRLRSIIR
jgi:integrase